MSKKNVVISVRLPVDLLAQLDEWISAQPVQPSRTAVMVRAFEQFIENNPVKSLPPSSY